MYIWIPNSGSVYFADTKAAAMQKADIQKMSTLGLVRHQKTWASISVQQRCRYRAFQVYIDIDVAGPAHKKTNLPASHEDAVDLLKSSLPLPPTILVDSGHGLHAYWFLSRSRGCLRLRTSASRQLLMRRFVLSFKYHRRAAGLGNGQCLRPGQGAPRPGHNEHEARCGANVVLRP